MDLTKPLERGRTLLVARKTYWVSFKYEKLPLFCFSCGRIVHEPSGCPIRSLSRGTVTGGEAQWRTWLKVETPKKPLGDFGGVRQRLSDSSDRPSTVARGSSPTVTHCGGEQSSPLQSGAGKCTNFGIPSSNQVTKKANGGFNRGLSSKDSSMKVGNECAQHPAPIPAVTPHDDGIPGTAFLFTSSTSLGTRVTHGKLAKVQPRSQAPSGTVFSFGPGRLGGTNTASNGGPTEAQSAVGIISGPVVENVNGWTAQDPHGPNISSSPPSDVLSGPPIQPTGLVISL